MRFLSSLVFSFSLIFVFGAFSLPAHADGLSVFSAADATVGIQAAGSMGMGECKPLISFYASGADANDALASIDFTITGDLATNDLNSDPDLFGGHAFLLIKETGGNAGIEDCSRQLARVQDIESDTVIGYLNADDFSVGVPMSLVLTSPSTLFQSPSSGKYFLAVVTSRAAKLTTGSHDFDLSLGANFATINTNPGVATAGPSLDVSNRYAYYFSPTPTVTAIDIGGTVLENTVDEPSGVIGIPYESDIVDIDFNTGLDVTWTNTLNNFFSLYQNTGNLFNGAPVGDNLITANGFVTRATQGSLSTCYITYTASGSNGYGSGNCPTDSMYAGLSFSGLSPDTWYTLTLGGTNPLRDGYGAILSGQQYRFKTAPDSTPPGISTGNPLAPAVFAVNDILDENFDSNNPGSVIFVGFNELVDHESIAPNFLQVFQDGDNENWCEQFVTDAGGNTFVFCLHKDFTPDASYTILLTGGFADIAGNENTDFNGFSVSFSTGQLGGANPSLTSSTPATSASSGPRLAVDPDFTIDFSEQIIYTPGDIVMYANTGNAENGAATGSAIAVTCTSSIVAHATRLTCSPNTALSYATWYRLNITTGINDLTGNALGATQSIQYYTVNDTAAPTVSAATPTSGATSQEINALAFSIVFSEDLDSDTITGQVSSCPTATSGGVCTSDAVAVSTVSLTGGDTLQFSLSGLSYSTWYKVIVGTGVEDLAGNALASIYTLPFQTRSAPVSVGGGGGAVIYFLPQVTTTSQAVQGVGDQVEPKLEFASAGDGVVRVKVLNRGSTTSIKYSTDPSFGVSSTAVIDVDNNALLRVDAGTTVVYAYIPSGIMYTYNISNTTSAVGKPVAEGEANSAPARYVFTRNMRYGMTGDDVRELQKILNQLGYNVTQKGKEIRTYGLRTVGAVRALQRANNLSPVGNVGPATRELINTIALP